jgi:hypothetical protein
MRYSKKEQRENHAQQRRGDIEEEKRLNKEGEGTENGKTLNKGETQIRIREGCI